MVVDRCLRHQSKGQRRDSVRVALGKDAYQGATEVLIRSGAEEDDPDLAASCFKNLSLLKGKGNE